MGCGGRDVTQAQVWVEDSGGATLSAALLNIYKLVMDGGALYGR